jgi:hypothetical protein
MNVIRAIENTSLLTVGVLCAVAISSIVLQSADLLHDNNVNVATAPVIQLPSVVIVGKRLSGIATSPVGAQHVAA